jgi:site-specific recombinase XerD
MSCTKYPILDGAFDAKMIEACYDDVERGMVRLLSITGMHISSLCNLKTTSLSRRGVMTYIVWVRPKTNKTMEARIPKQFVSDVEAFLRARRLGRVGYDDKIKVIAKRAGYEGISAMTFRHNRCIKAIQDHDGNPMLVAQVMGCSAEIVFRNYSKLSEQQLEDKERDANVED